MGQDVEKIEFYAAVGTCELLIIDRNPWAIELYRLNAAQLSLVGRIEVDAQDVLETETVPFHWRFVSGSDRPLLDG